VAFAVIFHDIALRRPVDGNNTGNNSICNCSCNISAGLLPAPDKAVGVIVPLFSNNSHAGDWDKVIDAKAAHPDVRIIAIVNPDSGSGQAMNAGIKEGVQRLKKAGVDVVGYVSTGYSWRDANDVTREVDNYRDWYGVDGIFFDEVAHWYGRENYYAGLVNHVKSAMPGAITIGNPGIDDAMSTYAGIFNVLVVYESEGFPPDYKLNNWQQLYGSYDRSNFAVLSFGIGSLNAGELKAVTKNVGWIFVTNGVMPNPWKELPPYFEELVADTEGL